MKPWSTSLFACLLLLKLLSYAHMEVPTLPKLATPLSTRSSIGHTLLLEGWDYGERSQAISQYDGRRQPPPYANLPSLPLA